VAANIRFINPDTLTSRNCRSCSKSARTTSTPRRSPPARRSACQASHAKALCSKSRWSWRYPPRDQGRLRRRARSLRQASVAERPVVLPPVGREVRRDAHHTILVKPSCVRPG
jgi:hypothetical protein